MSHDGSTKAVFLGAGASKAFGYPLTTEILPKIQKRLRKGNLFGSGKNDRKANAELGEYFGLLFAGWGRKGIETPPVTDVLSLLDYAQVSTTAPINGLPPESIARFRKLLERAIFRVIEEAFDGEAWPIRNRFLDWLLRETRDVGMITTNYDVEVDMGVFWHFDEYQKMPQKDLDKVIDFGFGWREPEGGRLYSRPGHPRFRLYKLHGSLNWLRCDLCEHTYINVYGMIAHQAFRTEQDPKNTCDCGHHPLSLVLVAPSLLRDIRNVDLLYTWKNALEWLRRAEDWFIIGYSFPPEDIAIRSMFIRAYRGRADMKLKEPKVTVVQKGQDPDLVSRFKLLFPNCEWEPGGLETFLKKQEKDSGTRRLPQHFGHPRNAP